jgi:hypothetical protein
MMMMGPQMMGPQMMGAVPPVMGPQMMMGYGGGGPRGMYY